MNKQEPQAASTRPLAGSYPASLLRGDSQHISDEHLRSLDLKISQLICSGYTNAQISTAICRYVNSMFATGERLQSPGGN